jgi:hypothetical protein
MNIIYVHAITFLVCLTSTSQATTVYSKFQERIARGRTDAFWVPELRLCDFATLKGLPCDEDMMIPMSSFTEKLHALLTEAAMSAHLQSFDYLMSIAKSESEIEAEFGHNTPSHAHVAFEISRIVDRTSQYAWKVFSGQDLFKLMSSHEYIRNELASIAIDALLRVPVNPGDELALGTAVGLAQFARDQSEWILTMHADDFEQRNLASYLDADFDENLHISAKGLANDELADILDGARQILASTAADEVLVFVGNSASYFYHALKTERPNSFLVPFSGGWYPLDFGTWSLKLADKFDSVMLDPIRELALALNSAIVLVDITIHGRSVVSFDKLLRRRNCDHCRTELLQISSSPGVLPKSNPKDIYVRAMIMVELDGFLVGSYVRLVPSFQHKLWAASSPALVRVYENRPVAAQAIQSIEEYVNRRGLAVESDKAPLINLVEYYDTKFSYGKGGEEMWQSHVTLPLSHWIRHVVKSMRGVRPHDFAVLASRTQYNFETVGSLVHLAIRLEYLIVPTLESYIDEMDFGRWAAELLFHATYNQFLRDQLVPSLMDLIERVSLDSQQKLVIATAIGLWEFGAQFPNIVKSHF